MSTAIENLVKALEAGSTNGTPSSLTNGSALQRIPMPATLQKVYADESLTLKLSNMIPAKKHDATDYYYNRQLSPGQLGFAAQLEETAVGAQQDAQVVKTAVPLVLYVDMRFTTNLAELVGQIDDKAASERQAEAAAENLAVSIELDMLKGKSDFSDAGVFNGNAVLTGGVPGCRGLDVEIRASDLNVTTQDLYLRAFGAAESVVFTSVTGLTQGTVEDMRARQAINGGNPDLQIMSMSGLANYNKTTALGMQRIVLGGSAQRLSGASLSKQATAFGEVGFEGHRLLEGKSVGLPRGVLAAPTASAAASGSGTTMAAGSYVYVVAARNANAYSAATVASAVTVAAGELVTLTIGASSGAIYFEVFRGTSAATAKFIGNVRAAASGNTSFIDLNNKMPGGSIGLLIDKKSISCPELAPFTKFDLLRADLQKREVFYQVRTIAVEAPRKNCLVDLPQ